MRLATLLTLITVALAGGIIALLSPLVVYYAVLGDAYEAYARGVLSLASVLVARAAILSSCIPPLTTAVALGLWSCIASLRLRNANPLLATLIIVASLLSITQTCYNAYLNLSPSIEYRVSLSVAKVINEGVRSALAYALRICVPIAAFCSTPSAVLGAALVGVGLLDRERALLRSAPRAIVFALGAASIVKTLLSMWVPGSTPIATSVQSVLSIALGASMLPSMREQLKEGLSARPTSSRVSTGDAFQHRD